MRRNLMTREEVEHAQSLDRAAAAVREARKRQDEATYLCIWCHGPDSHHVSWCPHAYSYATLNNGVRVLAHDRGPDALRPKAFANRTQAERASAKVTNSRVIGHRPYYVAIPDER